MTVGDRPELYFFAVSGEEVVVAISGSALKKFEETRRRLSREEKIDIAGLMLKRAMEAGKDARFPKFTDPGRFAGAARGRTGDPGMRVS